MQEILEIQTTGGVWKSTYRPSRLPTTPSACLGSIPCLRVCNEIIALPMYPELTADESDYTCDVIEKLYRKG